VILLVSLLWTTGASAHAELLQSSPRADSTIGGELHSIALQFGGLDTEAPQDAKLYDPAGNLVESVVLREKQRLVIPMENEITVPGTYTVTYEVNGEDGDFTSSSFTFRYEPGADPAEGITIANGAPSQGFDFVGYGLLLAAAAIAAFLVHRFIAAWREHTSAKAAFAATDSTPSRDPGPT
jgi:methionine-rich copper-binding protein CopC